MLRRGYLLLTFTCLLHLLALPLSCLLFVPGLYYYRGETEIDDAPILMCHVRQGYHTLTDYVTSELHY
eukprot:8990276-Pyramimonas_sp.AAC.1